MCDTCTSTALTVAIRFDGSATVDAGRTPDGAAITPQMAALYLADLAADFVKSAKPTAEHYELFDVLRGRGRPGGH